MKKLLIVLVLSMSICTFGACEDKAATQETPPDVTSTTAKSEQDIINTLCAESCERIKQDLLNPASFTLKSIKFVTNSPKNSEDLEDGRKFYIKIDYTAMNSAGGYGEDTSYYYSTYIESLTGFSNPYEMNKSDYKKACDEAKESCSNNNVTFFEWTVRTEDIKALLN